MKWSYLPKEYFQGQPVGYQIVYYPANAEGERISMNVSYTTNTKTLTNLTVYTMYVINMSAVSSGGIGPASTVEARTDAAGTVESLILYGRKIFPSYLCTIYIIMLRIMTVLSFVVEGNYIAS